MTTPLQWLCKMDEQCAESSMEGLENMQVGWTVQTKWISNDKYSRLRKLKELKLANDVAVMCHLFSDVEYSNEQLEHEVLYIKF